MPAAGQTYAQSLAKGGININDYISTGSNRKSFYGALAPRLGLSFDLNGDTRTVLYAGYGRAYDRAMANHAMDELQRNLGTGDQFMIRNDYKTPYSDQFSAGLRQALGAAGHPGHIHKTEHAGLRRVGQADDGSQSGQAGGLQRAGRAGVELGGEAPQHPDIVAGLEGRGGDQRLAADFVEGVLQFGQAIGGVDVDQHDAGRLQQPGAIALVAARAEHCRQQHGDTGGN